MLPSPNRALSLATLVGVGYTMIPTTLAGAASAHRHTQLHARQYAAPGATSQGCFSSAGGGADSGTYDQYQSSLSCSQTCSGYPVMALQGLYCFCAKLLPASSSAVGESMCNEACGGYGKEPCGGTNAFTVWLTGENNNVGSVSPSNSGSSSTSSSSTTIPSSTTKTPTPSPHHKTKSGGKHHHSDHRTQPSQGQSTVTKTKIQPGSTNSPDSQSGSPSSSSSTGSTIGIAVGVVAGIVAFAALVTIILFYLRRRRRMKNAENGHRRADSLNAFVASGARTPGSLAGKIPPVSMNDTRLDPRILQDPRRASAGSFLADNEDYSRRILKVTNPDGT